MTTAPVAPECLGCLLVEVLNHRVLWPTGEARCDQCKPPLTPSQKMTAAGFTRRKTGKTVGGLMLDPDD